VATRAPRKKLVGPASGRCSLGYPNQEHLDPAIEPKSEVVFCKVFELW
jgi:hypothetical protein